MPLGPGSDFPHLLFHISVTHCQIVIVPHEVMDKMLRDPVSNTLESLEEEFPYTTPTPPHIPPHPTMVLPALIPEPFQRAACGCCPWEPALWAGAPWMGTAQLSCPSRLWGWRRCWASPECEEFWDRLSLLPRVPLQVCTIYLLSHICCSLLFFVFESYTF